MKKTVDEYEQTDRMFQRIIYNWDSKTVLLLFIWIIFYIHVVLLHQAVQ